MEGVLRAMTKGPAGYGRYNDSPEYVGCPRAKSDMTPCIARDGSTALSGGDRGLVAKCVGCGVAPSVALADLRKELPGKDRSEISCVGHPKAVANRLQVLVRKVTEPETGGEVKELGSRVGNRMYLADGTKVPDVCIEALNELDSQWMDNRWPGTALEQARRAVVAAVLAAYTEKEEKTNKAEFEPGDWWKVVGSNGIFMIETKNMQEAKRIFGEYPGSKLLRSFERTQCEAEWREQAVDDIP